MSFGREANDWQERINWGRMAKERNARANAALKKHGLGAVITLTGANTRYIATGNGQGFQNLTGHHYAFMPAGGEPVMFENGMFFPAVKSNISWMKVKRGIAALGQYGGLAFNPSAYKLQLKKFAEGIMEEVKANKLKSEKIGLDFNDAGIIKALQDEGLEVSLDGSAALVEARNIKTKDEIECMRVISSILDACFAAVGNALKPGITENEVAAVIAYTGYKLGAEAMDTPFVTSGPNTWEVQPTFSDRIVRPGELVFMDLYNDSFGGQRSCYYRTFSIGTPTEAQKDTYAKVRDWSYDAIKLMKPGATTKEMALKWPKAEEFGRLDEDGAVMMQWSHGIGLSIYEPPFTSRIWSLEHPDTLKEGMTLAVETMCGTGEKSPGYPNGQGVRLEEMVVVTSNGVEVMSRFPVDELTVCRAW